MRIGRRRIRSTQTSAVSVKRMNGRNRIVVRAATSNAVDSSTITATPVAARAERAERFGVAHIEDVRGVVVGEV
jgi:hypothetical protein